MEALHWWYRDAASQSRIGPVSARGLQALLDAQVISPQTCIWCEGMPWWLPLEEVEELTLSAAAALKVELAA